MKKQIAVLSLLISAMGWAQEDKPQTQKKEKEKLVKAREQKKRMSYFEKQEWETIEADIEELEVRIEAIEMEMEQNGSDFTKLSELQKELDDKNEQLLEKYERYEYLSELE